MKQNIILLNMKNLIHITIIFTVFQVFTVQATKLNEPPAWAKNAIWYQIMVERFNNGDPNNDPTVALMKDEKMHIIPPAGWHITPWTQSWYKPDDWMTNQGKSFQDEIFYRRYGGDLQGVLDKIDYLQELGVTAVYFNPLNDAPSLHKYDARSYHHIDVNFGPDPEGDLKIIASENPGDPATWQWTSADKIFLKVVDELHKRGMRVILDFSWNHTGTQFWAWLDILKNQQNSPYKEWYNISTFDNPATPENEFHYEGWMGNAYMPEVKKTDITTPRKAGNPYEGNIHPGPKQHIFDVTRRWLAPNGDVSKGIDGFRLDVADHVGLGFWRDWRRHVRSINPDAYLIGEIWWQQWPENLMDPKPYLQGDVFDAVMFYQVYRPARYFFAENDLSIDAAQLKDSLQYHWNRLKPETVKAMMNVSSSHDAPRLATDFYNPNKYKYHANTHENPDFKTGKADAKSMNRLRLYLIHLFTIPGAPQIWNGEEMGMWGADDPHCRKPLMWPEIKFEPEIHQALQSNPLKPVDQVKFDKKHFKFYQQLIKIRKDNPVLADGDIEFVKAEGKILIYRRFNADNEILVLFNLSDKSFQYRLDKEMIDLMNGKKSGDKIVLKAETGYILKSGKR
jgi:glycosidase